MKIKSSLKNIIVTQKKQSISPVKSQLSIQIPENMRLTAFDAVE